MSCLGSAWLPALLPGAAGAEVTLTPSALTLAGGSGLSQSAGASHSISTPGALVLAAASGLSQSAGASHSIASPSALTLAAGAGLTTCLEITLTPSALGLASGSGLSQVAGASHSIASPGSITLATASGLEAETQGTDVTLTPAALSLGDLGPEHAAGASEEISVGVLSLGIGARLRAEYSTPPEPEPAGATQWIIESTWSYHAALAATSETVGTPSWTIEGPSPTAFTNSTPDDLALDALAPFEDGTWWLDVDGVTLVGWDDWPPTELLERLEPYVSGAA